MFAKRFSYLLIFLCMVQAAAAQRPAVDSGKQEGKKINIIYADRLGVMTVDSLHKFTTLVGKAHVLQEKTHFYADSIVMNEVDNSLEAFGNIHINDADSVQTYSQYLKYLGKEKKAFLKKKVRLTDGKGELTSDTLEYDVTLKIGTYLKGGKVVNKKTVLTSKEGYYYGDTKDVFFKRNVVLIDPDYKVVTDTLQYNTNTEIATFTSPTIIYSDSGRRTIKTRQGYFDMKNKRGILNQRSVVEDSTATFTADDMAVDDSTKLSEARGNAVYRGKDTAKGFDLIANNIKTNRKKDILLATEKPILLIKQGRDSIYVSGDTMYTARLSDLMKTRRVPGVRDGLTYLNDTVKAKTATPVIDSAKNKKSVSAVDSAKDKTLVAAVDSTKEKTLALSIDSTKNKPDSSTDKYFEVYNNVKIFSDSLQARGDSLFYSLKDSVFRLFRNPIVWAKENQITGDTIYLFVKNKNPERLFVFENAMAISKVDSTQYFNQLKSTSLNAWFVDGKIHYMRAKGSAENVYYGQDEQNRFIGVNKSTSDMINVIFEDSKPARISFLRNVDHTGYPMHQVNHDDIKIRGFKWLDSIRPKTKFDILAN